MTVRLQLPPEVTKSTDHVVVSMGGRDYIDMEALEECRRKLKQVLSEDDDVVVMDLADVQIIGTLTFCLLLSLRQRGLEVRLQNVAPLVHEVLSLTRLDTLFAVADSAQ